MNIALRGVALSLVSMLLGTCASSSTTTTTPAVSSAAMAATAASVTAADEARHLPEFVLLGELHDNPDHHRARAEQLRRLIEQEPTTAVVFEQFSRDEDAAMCGATSPCRTARADSSERCLDVSRSASVIPPSFGRREAQSPTRRA